MIPEVCILAKPSVRLSYVCEWLFQEQFGLPFQIVSAETTSKPENHQVFTVSYQQYPTQPTDLTISPATLLYENGIPSQTLTDWNNFSDKACDWFAALFFLLTAVPWYQTQTKDSFQRIDESNIPGLSVLKHPVADEIVLKFRKNIQAKFPDWKFPVPTVKTEWTFDFDSPWKYQHKPLWIQAGSLVKQFFRQDWSGISERFHTKDPFETDELLSVFKESGKVKVFVLHGTGHPHDSRFPFTLPAWRKRIYKLAEYFPVGIHPSFLSADEPERIWKEKQWLEEILERQVIASRQHFLKLRFPDTLRTLLECGIREDYSAACYSMAGFKHGTSHSFYWFDLLKNEITPLRIFPGSWMDRTQLRILPTEKHFTLTDVFAKLQAQYKMIQTFGGTQRILLHNDTLSNSGEWKGWRDYLLAENYKRKSANGVPE